MHFSEYNGYHIFVWIYGVSHGGYVYAFKMYVFEKVRARNFARAWGFAQMAMALPTLIGIPAASEFIRPPERSEWGGGIENTHS